MLDEYLLGQFSGGGQDQGLGALQLNVNLLQDGDGEGGSLPCARLGLSNHIETCGGEGEKGGKERRRKEGRRKGGEEKRRGGEGEKGGQRLLNETTTEQVNLSVALWVTWWLPVFTSQLPTFSITHTALVYQQNTNLNTKLGLHTFILAMCP